ncbi:MAG TPA: TlpA disulfide reductase family protein, partial [Pyrinomonadaceae bacterium]|nr:TlpA disulfide reductase family protein [Pyrinomonadaceae bacterium]
MRTFSIFILSLVLAATALAQQNLKVGSAAPDFAAEGMDGKTYNLSQLQGKVVVLTFWSTRCEICHSEIPKLNQVAEHYRGRDVVFLAVTMDNQVKVEPYLRKTPFIFNILPNSFGVFLKYADKDAGGNINMGFPAHFLIDRHGAIKLRTDGWDKAANLDSQ